MHYSKAEDFMEEVMFELGLLVMAWRGEGLKGTFVRRSISQGPEGG